MIEICSKNECTGCSACYNACGHSAILMKPDECGYIYPFIDNNKCVECGVCKKVCPVNNPRQLLYPISCFAATVNSENELLSCASGGVATILGESIIKLGGVVYGCDGSNIRNVHHSRKLTIESLNKLKGSKYVQSNIGDIYKLLKKDVISGKPVLFIGTPCQVAGLGNYLHSEKYPNLYTVDLVCHGVPSQKMLNDNINNYTNEENISVSFRKKNVNGKIKYGWYLRSEKNKIKSAVNISYRKDPYLLGFLSCLTIRENCTRCRYACIARCSDITLSDFWGLSDTSKFEKGKGVSNVLVNTEKGMQLWNNSREVAKWEERTIVEALSGNGQLQTPSAKNGMHDQFVKLYPIIGFKNAVKRCSYKYLIKDYIKTLISRFF